MARPQRNTVDYFPHDCSHGRKMFIIETKFGNDGYAVWFKLLEQLGLAEHHFLDLRDHTQKMYLSSIMRVDVNTFDNILKELSDMGAIDEGMYTNHSIVWSEKFVSSIQDAHSRRSNKCMHLQGLCSHLSIKCLPKQGKCSRIVSINPQSKEEDIKEEETKLKQSIENPFSDSFINIWDQWKDYKKSQFNFIYKSAATEQAALTELLKASEGNEKNAIEIINQSIGNGWKGFFKIKLKQISNGQQTTEDRQTDILRAVYKKFNPTG